MKPLKGKISDKIRGADGGIPADVHVVGPRPEADDRPSPEAVRNGKGHALGRPSWRTKGSK